jgi:hypothetical protein
VSFGNVDWRSFSFFSKGAFMNVNSRQKNAALVFAVAAVIGAGKFASPVFATTYTTNSSTEYNVETTTQYNNTTSFEIYAGTSGYPNFGLFNFSSTLLMNANGTGIISSNNQVLSINSDAQLTLGDFTDSYNTPGSTFAVYLCNNPSALSGATYTTANAPQGISPTLLSNLIPLGNITYPAIQGTGNSTVTPLTLTSAAESYLVNQINTSGNISIIVAPTLATSDVAFTGPTSSSPPILQLDLTTEAGSVSNSNFTFNTSLGGTGNISAGVTAKALTINLGRVIYNSANATLTVPITNSGTGNGTYTLTGSASSGTEPGGVGTAGTEPVGTGATSTITVGLASQTLGPGSITPSNPVSATVTVNDISNSSDAPAVITVTASQLVASRIIDNVGYGNANTTIVPFGKILGGTSSAPQIVTLDTENTNIPDYTSNSVTTVELVGNATLTSKFSNSTVFTDGATVNTGTSNTTFNGAGNVDQTANVTVTFNAGATAGGLYQSKASALEENPPSGSSSVAKDYYDGYISIPLTNLDNALGASATPTARIYTEADVYQPASVTNSVSGNNVLLTNAAHTNNNVTIYSQTVDIGARASAQVVSVNLVGQAGYTTNLAPNTMIVDSAADVGGLPVTAASFAPAGKWNGTYTGTLTVGLENDQTSGIYGVAPNDLPTQVIPLSMKVSGNTGPASVNVLAGGSFAGYSISSGTAENSNVSLLGGTSTSGNTITLSSFAAPSSSHADSERATITETGSDTFVLQIADPLITNDSVELAYTNGSGVNVLAVSGDTGGTPAEVAGPYNGTTTLGAYGVDPIGHTAWAVINHIGTFEAFSRLLGDTNGDGTVSVNDLSLVLANLGTTSALWSQGNFDGAATIDLTDLNDVLNNIGTSLPTGAVATPEPTTLGIGAFAVAGLVLRRRRAAR